MITGLASPRIFRTLLAARKLLRLAFAGGAIGAVWWHLALPQVEARMPLKKGGKPPPMSAEERLIRKLTGRTVKGRIEAARMLGERRAQNAILPLIEALTDEQRAPRRVIRYREEKLVCYWADWALRKITGENKHFSPYDSAALREQAVLRWRRWYLEEHR